MSTTSRLGLSFPAGTDPADVPAWMNALAVELDGMIAPTSHGPLASRPVSSVGTPGIADRMYYATDVDPDTVLDRANVNGQLYRDNGTGWDPIGPFASKMAVGNFASPAAIGNQDITGLGFQPKMVDFTFIDTGSTSNQSLGGHGAMSAASQWTWWFRDRESSGDSVNDWQTNACIRVVDLSGSAQWRALYGSMLADGFRLNWALTAGTGLKIGYKAWG